MKVGKDVKKDRKVLKTPSGRNDIPTDDKWWEKAVGKEEKNQHGLVNVHTGMNATDAPDGDLDIRQISRAQRAVWNKYIHMAKKEDIECFTFLKSKERTDRGKEKEANTIINASVPRDAGWNSTDLKPKSMTISRLHIREEVDEKGVEVTGMKLRTFIGCKFSGNKELFEEAKDNGEVYEDDDALWYAMSKSHKRTRIVKDSDPFEESKEAKDTEDLRKAIMCNLADESDLSSWMGSVQKKNG